MNTNIRDLEEILTIQESYYENILKLGLLFENSGQPEKAFDLYKRGLIKADQARKLISGTMLGLLD